jgi:hypothetical protein
MTTAADFQSVFDRLKTILQKYQTNLVLKADQADHYYLETPYIEKYKREIMFGAVQVKKNYVSYHLFPVYVFPELLVGLTPGLKKRMQGKSCFNFTAVDDALLVELERLTQAGFERFRLERLAR